MSRLKMAVIGVGALGRHHARILSELDAVELVAVSETDPEKGDDVARKYGTRWEADYRKLFAEVDAVSIVVPTTAHLLVASDFLKQGIPTLVEKPIACDAEQAEELVRLAESNRALLQVGHIERFNPATQTAWKFCGEPKYIRAERLSPYSFRSTDIGVVLDVMIHDLDLVLDLVDSPLRSVDAFGLGLIGGHEDCVQARLTFENGCIADLTASRINPTPKRTMQIWSSTGTVTVDFSTREVVHYSPSEKLLYGKPLLEQARQPGADIEELKQKVFGTYLTVESPSVPNSDALTAELTSFVACVLSEDQPLVGGEEALYVMKIAQHVLDRVAEHQWDGHPDGAIGPDARFSQISKLAG